jgi:rSAM/selenodomain-associated transferase 2
MRLHSPLSVVVPVLNESAIIAAFFQRLRAEAPEAEIIAVDGGSDDGTLQLCDGLADIAVVARRGRASQMNAGAAISSGAVLWFLHADSELPSGAVASIAQTLSDPRCVGGCFRLRFPRREWVYRISDSLGNLGVDVFGFALGDHGIFSRRDAFEAAGGFPDVPILEDAEFYRALRCRGKMLQLRAEIVSSPRRYERLGPGRTTAYYALILALYVAGVSNARLHRLYQRLHRRDSAPLDAPALHGT